MYVNPWSADFDNTKQYAFLRATDKECLLVVANFSEEAKEVSVNIPEHAFEFLHLKEQEKVVCTDLLTGETKEQSFSLSIPVKLSLLPNNGLVMKIVFK